MLYVYLFYVAVPLYICTDTVISLNIGHLKVNGYFSRVSNSVNFHVCLPSQIGSTLKGKNLLR